MISDAFIILERAPNLVPYAIISPGRSCRVSDAHSLRPNGEAVVQGNPNAGRPPPPWSFGETLDGRANENHPSLPGEAIVGVERPNPGCRDFPLES